MQMERSDGTAIEKEFDESHSAMFEQGVVEVRYFARPGSGATADALMEEATRFQNVIQSGQVRQVRGID